MTPLPRKPGGRHLTAAERGLADRWHAGPGCRYFVEGDIVKVSGLNRARFRVLGFRTDGTADVFGGRPGQAFAVRTVDAHRLGRADDLTGRLVDRVDA